MSELRWPYHCPVSVGRCGSVNIPGLYSHHDDVVHAERDPVQDGIVVCWEFGGQCRVQFHIFWFGTHRGASIAVDVEFHRKLFFISLGNIL